MNQVGKPFFTFDPLSIDKGLFKRSDLPFYYGISSLYLPFCLFFYDSFTVVVSLEMLGFTFKRGSEFSILASVSNIFTIVLTKATQTTLSTSSI